MQSNRDADPACLVHHLAAATIDGALERLSSSAASWASTVPSERARLLEDCLSRLAPLAKEAAHEGASAKGAYGCGDGEEL